MAWNPHPMVRAAADFGEKFGADHVVIIFINTTGQPGYASWGKTKRKCGDAKKLADRIWSFLSRSPHPTVPSESPSDNSED